MIDVIHGQGGELGSLLGASGGRSPSDSAPPGLLRSIPSSDARQMVPSSVSTRPPSLLPRLDLNRIWLCLWVKMGMQLWCLVCAAAALAIWLD